MNKLPLPTWMITVTPASRIITAVLLIALPFGGFILGTRFPNNPLVIDNTVLPVTTKTVSKTTVPVTTTVTTTSSAITTTVAPDAYAGWKEYKSVEFGVTVKLPPSFYVSGKQYIIDGANKNADVVTSDSSVSCSKYGGWLKSPCDDTSSQTYSFKSFFIKSRLDKVNSVVIFDLPPYEDYRCYDMDPISGKAKSTSIKTEAELTMLGVIYEVTNTFYTDTNKTCQVTVGGANQKNSGYPEAAASSKWKIFSVNGSTGITEISDKANVADNHGLSDVARKILESIKYS